MRLTSSARRLEEREEITVTVAGHRPFQTGAPQHVDEDGAPVECRTWPKNEIPAGPWGRRGELGV